MMKSETAPHLQPITPPNVHQELQHPLHQIAQYNEDRHYPVNEVQRHGSAYGSPGPSLHDAPHHHGQYQGTPGETHPGADFGLGIQFDRYGQDSAYYSGASFNGYPNHQSFVSGSPPTPSSGIDNDEADRRTRSGRAVVSHSPPHQPEPKPRPKATPKSKKQKAKGEKPKTPKLTAALSILTRNMTEIPVRNMEEWVNRSAETRRKEVEKRNGYVTRPMNSFMLYRSAYAERTKQWCLQNNHQVVSSVSGESWPLEPPEIRELYNEYAKIERINHQNAHPTYKFSPSKAAAPVRKRKSEFSDDEPSDLEDTEWAPGNRGHQRRPSKRSMDRSIGYPANSIGTELFDRSFGNNHGLNRSSWDMTNAGRPMPMPIHSGDMVYNHQYYQTNMHPNMGMQHVMEDPRMRRVDNPNTLQFSSGSAMLGLPGGNAADMMQQLHSHVGTPLGDEGQVDPMLLAFDGDRHPDLGPAMVPQPEYRNGHLNNLEREPDQDSVHSFFTEADDYHSQDWHPDPAMAQLEPNSEFDKWMDAEIGR